MGTCTASARPCPTRCLDFEIVGYDLRAIDLVSAMYAWCWNKWSTGDEWTAMETVVRGYTSVQRLTLEEIQALPDLMRLRRAVIFLHMGGRFLNGDGPVDLLHYGVNHTLQFEDWLAANAGELVWRVRAWTGK